MRRRPAILGTLVAVLLIGDTYWAYENYFRLNAAITYIGLDSVVMIVPVSAHAPQLHNGKWDADPLQTFRSKFYDPPAGEKPKPMAYVSLGAHPGFGKAVEVIRDLKARRMCHVVIRESGTVTSGKVDFGKGPEAILEIPSIVLCGYPYGDGSSFDGRLPADHFFHVGAAGEEPNVR